MSGSSHFYLFINRQKDQGLLTTVVWQWSTLQLVRGGMLVGLLSSFRNWPEILCVQAVRAKALIIAVNIVIRPRKDARRDPHIHSDKEQPSITSHSWGDILNLRAYLKLDSNPWLQRLSPRPAGPWLALSSSYLALGRSTKSRTAATINLRSPGL